EAALQYLALGWSPIPLCTFDHEGMSGQHQQDCKNPGKAPWSPWKKYQEEPPTPAALNHFWNCIPQSNVGIAMGPVSELLGLDIDGQEGKELLAEWANGQEIPPTLEFSTPGGGCRLLFKWPYLESVPIKSHKAKKKEAIRILSEGSQTVAPPSRHAS